RGAGRQPAPGVLPAAQLQPEPQRDRALLEEAQAAGDAQPAVRHPRGAEGVGAGQPQLLPNPPGEDPHPHQRTPQEVAQMTQYHRVHVWETERGRPVKELPVGNGVRLAFSPDGKRLAVRGAQGGHILAVGTWQEGPAVWWEGDAAFSPDSSFLAVDS